MKLTKADELLQKILEEYGTADIATVRHGYWKETDDTMFRACSVCGYLEYECNEGNYCPNCGAKMDGDKE